MTHEQQTSRLEGRVASILNAKEIVINIGFGAGVKVGQTFAVLAETPIEVRDPETKELLDTLDREKIRIHAHEVRERIAVCRTYRVVAGLLASASTARIMGEILHEGRVESLRIEKDVTPPPLSDEELYVKINDRVVAV